MRLHQYSIINRIIIPLLVILGTISIADRASANIAVLFSEHIYITEVFMINLPINLFCIFIFHIGYHHFYNRKGPKLMRDGTSFAQILSLGVVVTIFGSFIDSYIVAYPIMAFEAGEGSFTFMVLSITLALGLIFLSFLILPVIIMNYRFTKSLLLGLSMVVINFVSWTFFFYPFFVLEGGSIINDSSLMLSLISCAIIIIIFNLFTIYQISSLRSKAELKEYFRIGGDANRLFRLAIIIMFSVFIMLLYLSPLVNEGSREKNDLRLGWWPGGGYKEFEITVHQLDVVWYALLIIPVCALEIQKMVEIYLNRTVTTGTNA